MPGKSVFLCEAVKTHLESQPWNITNLTFTRRNFGTFRAEEVATPYIIVAPVSLRRNVDTRKDVEVITRVSVSLVQLLNTLSTTEQDELIEVAENLPQAMETFWHNNYSLTQVDGDGDRVIFDEAEMETYTVFMAQTILAFRSTEDI